MDTWLIGLLVFGVALSCAVSFWVGQKIGILITHMHWHKKIPSLRKEAIDKSRSVLTGKISEQLSPYLPEFGFNPHDVRFIGSPIDFVVFNGLSSNAVSELVFVEVKTGNAQLSERERQIKKVIENKKIRYIEYRF